MFTSMKTSVRERERERARGEGKDQRQRTRVALRSLVVVGWLLGFLSFAYSGGEEEGGESESVSQVSE